MSTYDLESQGRAWDALEGVRRHPQVQQWLAESGARAQQPRSRRLMWAAAASLALAVGAAGMYGYSLFGPRQYSTGIGEQRDIVLKDGSLVTLNTGSAITVHYDRNLRRIELRQGEALFAVRRDRRRPFEVLAGHTLTRALGTEFNVDMRRSQVTVSVLDGAVRVSRNANTIATLSKGEAVEVPAVAQKRPRVSQAADLKRIDAWRTRKLEFSDTPLAAAVEEFNRYSGTQVVIGTPDLETVRVSGVFRVGDTDGFLYSLREALGVQTHESAGEVTLMRR